MGGVVDQARLVLGVMFAAARIRNETVGLLRFAGDAGATRAGVEIEHSATPSKDLAIAWFDRAQRPGATENATYAVRFFRRGKSVGTVHASSGGEDAGDDGGRGSVRRCRARVE